MEDLALVLLKQMPDGLQCTLENRHGCQLIGHDMVNLSRIKLTYQDGEF